MSYMGLTMEDTAPRLWVRPEQSPRLMLLFHSGAWFQYLYCFSNVRETNEKLEPDSITSWWITFCTQTQIQGILAALPQAKKACFFLTTFLFSLMPELPSLNHEWRKSQIHNESVSDGNSYDWGATGISG